MKLKDYARLLINVVVNISLCGFALSCGGGGDEPGSGPLQTASITLVATPTSIPADGGSSSTITAIIVDNSGNPVHTGTDVAFSTTLGLFPNKSTSFNINTPPPLGPGGQPDPSGAPTGIVSVSLTAGNISGSAKVTVTSNGVSNVIYISFTGNTAAIAMLASPTTIWADGKSSSAIQAILTDATGSAVTQGTSVTFTTNLGNFQNGSQTYTITTVDTTGIVTTSLISGSKTGTAHVSAVSDSVTQSVYVNLTEKGGNPYNITLVADPTSIQADGASSSKITATMTDSLGNPVNPGTSVTFSTTLGEFSNQTKTIEASTTDDTGVVSVSLTSGTTAGTAIVTATTDGVTQKVSVVFTGGWGGPPYGSHLGLTPEIQNIAGLVYDGLEDTMTMRVTDRFFNTVPDGTTVNFTSNYGAITPTATTLSDPSTSYALATLTSAVPRPPDGFVTPVTSTLGGTDARVLCIAIHPDDTDIIYIGTDGGGIFKTIDGGDNWSQVGVPTKGLVNAIVWDIEIDSENTAIVYAGTENGVFVSTGGGDEWERIDAAKSITGESLGTLDTTDADEDGYSKTYTLTYSSNRIRSKTHVYLNNVETNEYVYASVNTIKFIVKDLTNSQAITIDYTTPAMIPANYPIRALTLGTATTGAPETDRTLYAGTLGKGVYKSTDSGYSWAASNSGLSDQDILSLAINPTTNAILYAGTQGGGIFKSTDSAGTWAASNSGLPASVIRAITIDPNTTSRIYVGTEQNGVFYSTDSAATWTAPTTNVTSVRVDKIVLDSSGGATATEIYAGTYGDGTDPLGGVYKSADSGAVWSRLTALEDNHVLALGIIGGSADTLFAGTWGRYIFKSADGGSTWTKKNGSAPNTITNEIFATTKVLFSAHTTSVIIVQTATSWQGAGGLEYKNTSNRNVIYNQGTASFIYMVQDTNGNPLIAGTTITASATAGSLSGDTSVTLADGQSNTNYGLTWTNNSDATENVSGTLTVSVDTPVENGNGDMTTSVTRTLIKPVTIVISPAIPAAGNLVTVTPSGGSETTTGGAVASTSGYSIAKPLAATAPNPENCNFGSTVTYNAGVSTTPETVIVTDNVTGGTATASYTVP